jgi:hypothetical protein
MTEDSGQSITRSGEEVVEQEGHGPDRDDKGEKGESSRPYGTSTPRDATGVNPLGPIDPDSPYLPPA